MKKILSILYLTTTFIGVFSISKGINAETFGCPASPKIGDNCTKRVTIRLRKLESEGRDEFDRRFEPSLGWAIQDCDARSGERGSTGEVSHPSCVEVQAGTINTSSTYIQTQANRVYENISKARVQGGNESAQGYAEMENKARAEFSNLEKIASVHASRNYGQRYAWARNPFGSAHQISTRGNNQRAA